MEDFSKLPKGSTNILTYILDRGYDSISRMLEKLSMSPHQAYRCLAWMESKGILLREEYNKGKRMISSYRLSKKGILVAVAVDALDKALKRPSGLCRRPYSGKER
jgi:CTP-dependent riboflavin kinase